MPDNLNIDAGSTLTVATDLIGGVHYQRVKIAHGDDSSAADAGPSAPFPVTIQSATLGTVTIAGSVNIATATLGTVTVSLSSTSVTVANSPLNVNVATATLGTVTISGNVNVATATLGTVTVSLSSTAVTVANTPLNVNVATATLGTVTISGSVNVATATLGTVTISGNVNVASATLGTVTVSLSSTAVTVANSPLNVNVATATLGTVTVSATNSVSTIPIVGRTLTGSTGSLSATTGTVTIAPTNRAKVYGFSLTTTSSTELICIFHTGGLELWRLTLQAPSGASVGANLAVDPPNFLFASRTGTAVSLSLSSAVLVHYSTSYFDEA